VQDDQGEMYPEFDSKNYRTN